MIQWFDHDLIINIIISIIIIINIIIIIIIITIIIIIINIIIIIIQRTIPSKHKLDIWAQTLPAWIVKLPKSRMKSKSFDVTNMT